MIGFSIRLFPTEEQKDVLKSYFGASRYVYNWAKDQEEIEYSKNKGFLTEYSLNNRFIQFKKENPWLNDYDSTSLKIRIFDLVKAFRRFFNNQNRYPKYKSKKDRKQTIAVRTDTMSIYENKVRIPGIGYIKCGSIPNKGIIGNGWKRKDFPETHRKYYNARLIYIDGIYTLSFTMEEDYTIPVIPNSVMKYNRALIPRFNSYIGIDLGCKGNNWIVDSLGNRVSLPDNSNEIKKIENLSRILSRKILHQRTNGETYRETKNIRKIKDRIGKYYLRMRNTRLNTLYNYISHNILSLHPIGVVLEDIRVTDFMKSEYNSDLVYSQRAMFNNKISNSALYYSSCNSKKGI